MVAEPLSIILYTYCVSGILQFINDTLNPLCDDCDIDHSNYLCNKGIHIVVKDVLCTRHNEYLLILNIIIS